MAGAENKSGREVGARDARSIRQRLDALEGELTAARGRKAPPSAPESRGKAFSQALRLATEMVAGVIVGGLIGWVLDSLLGTAPVLMVVFLVLGSAAGILNVVRTAKSMQAKALSGKDLPHVEDDDD